MRFLNILPTIYFIILILWAFAIISCSTQKRLNNLLDRNPELRQNEIIQIDTIIQVTTPKDSLSIKLPIIEIKDTVFFQSNSEQLSVTLWRDNYDTLYINAKCDTVTLYIPFEKTVEVEKIIYKKARDGLIWWVVLAVVILIIITAIRKLLS